jgi:hypothetical protein
MQHRDQDPESVDQALLLEDLSLKTIISLIARLKSTETDNQMVCRELELDDAYRRADMDLREAENESAATIAEFARVREIVTKAHDLVGESRLDEAIRELNGLVEMKIGL